MVEHTSPLGSVFRSGSYGNLSGGAGVRLSEATPPSIVEAAAWPEKKEVLIAAIAGVTGLSLPPGPNAGATSAEASAFSIGPGRYLVTGGEALAERLAQAVTLEIGTMTDISHGRTAIRIAGPRAEWVLSKLFAIDFSPAAFPTAAGCATAHHEIFAQIQRTGEDQFDIFVFRSFARSFWTMICDAAEEVGYEAVSRQNT